MKQASRRSRKSFSAGAVLGTTLLLCLAAMLAAAPAAFSAPARAPYVVVLKDDVAHPANVAHRHEENRGARVSHVYGVAIKGYSATLTPGAVKAIRKDPNVDYVERDGVIRPKGQVVGTQLKRVYAAQNPQLDIDGVDDARVNVDIAILDTGVTAHPDLNVVSRVNCVEYSGSGPCKAGQANDDVAGHGTHVAGDAAAIDNGIGVVGTAPGARIWSVKVVNHMDHVGSDDIGITLASASAKDHTAEGNAHMSDAIAGINWVTINSSQIEVANMSFACETDEGGCARVALKEAIATSVNNGVVWVAAAGQVGSEVAGSADNNMRYYPALLSDVITVSAMADYDGLRGSLSNSDGCPLEKGFQHDDRLMGQSGGGTFLGDQGTLGSNYGPEVDMTAPGSCVFSTWSPNASGTNAYGVPNGNEYGVMNGSSVASALVAGAAADIAAQYNPNNRADVEQIKAALLGAGNYDWEDLRNDFGELVPADGVKEPLLSLDGVPYIPSPTQPPVNPPPVTPPTVVFTGVSNIGLNSATLSGTVNPQGVEAHYQFQCKRWNGTDFDPYFTVADGSVPAGSSAVPVSVNFTGFEVGTGYQCRLMANNAGGLTYGPTESSFNTKKVPVVQTLRPAEVTKSKIVMAARFESGDPGTYYFEYGPTGSYGSKTAEKAFSAGSGFQPAAPAPVEEALVGWTVHYRLVVKTNSIGTYVGGDQIGTTAWTHELSSGPAGAKSDKLLDVSCATATNCVAVGYYVSSGSTVVPAGERWNGSSWVLATPPAPEGAISTLNGVSCSTTTSCMAVGTKQVGGLDQPLAMQWNGSAWSATPAPVGPGYTNYLNDVACTAANSCDAVGYSAPSGWEIAKPLVMHWNGSAWAVKTSANPNSPGGNPTEEDNKLQSVSCASASVCMAVGLHHANVGGVETYQPLVERLSGEEWVSQEVKSYRRNLSAIPNIQLNGVSCSTTTNCMAVGYAAPGVSGPGVTPNEAFVATWNGSEWLDFGPAMEASSPTNLLGVSCSSPTSCRAVGPGPRGLHWTGSQGWKLEGPKVPVETIGYEETLNAISCPTAAECKAVGSYRNTSTYLGRYIVGWSGAGVAPKVGTTYTSDGIGETSATMVGWVGSEGVDTKYYFEYGLTEAYGSKTAEASAGSWPGMASGFYRAGALLTGLKVATKYHYRIVATNGSFTEKGPDATFETKGSILSDLPVTEPFNGTTSAVSDFATKWFVPNWLPGTVKGTNTASGWAGGVAYFKPPVADTGSGIGSVVTMAVNPGSGGRVSLLLDVPSAAATKTGYELRLLQTGTDLYTVSLKKWNSGVETTLASVTEYPFVNGNSLALTDKGGTVSALTNTGSGFTEILSAADSTFSGGSGGVEAAGSATRLTKFKVGPLAEKAASFDVSAKAVPVTDALSRTESPLSLSGSWAALSWDTATVKTAQVESTYGWGPAETTSSIFGAYWQKAMTGDTGTGNVSSATFTYPAIGGFGNYYFALWLNAPSPGTAKSGYQLRISETSPPAYEAKLIKWVNGVATTLATKTGITFPNGNPSGAKFALADKAGTVSFWLAQAAGGSFQQVISAADSTYSYGYGGIEGSGSPRLKDFKLGQLGLY